MVSIIKPKIGSLNFLPNPTFVWPDMAGRTNLYGELIYACKIEFLAVSNLQVRIKPAFFSRFSQPGHFFRFKPVHLLLNRARFTGYNLCYYLTFLAGLNLQVQTWINMQVSPDNPILQAQINSPTVYPLKSLTTFLLFRPFVSWYSKHLVPKYKYRNLELGQMKVQSTLFQKNNFFLFRGFSIH